MAGKKVSEDRWKQALAWESSLWESIEHKRGWKRPIWMIARPFFRLLGLPGGAKDDFNHWWEKQLDFYNYLPKEISNYIELGCGPYTNTRLILKERKAKHIILSDPLIRNYIRYRRTWLARQYKTGAICIDPNPAENCLYADGTFDVVVMINVLDHVMDVDQCLSNAIRIARKGGFFIFGQDLTDEEGLRRFPYDVGHPIRLNLEEIEPYLTGFQPVLRKVLSREEGRAPEAHYGTLLFVGRKTENSK
ncbi:MAG: methyltransferase domain-containing protein [Candidatus Deferrimicrobiaceae bacterium]